MKTFTMNLRIFIISILFIISMVPYGLIDFSKGFWFNFLLMGFMLVLLVSILILTSGLLEKNNDI